MDIDHLITRYFAGETTKEELMKLKTWLEEDPKHKESFELLRTYWLEEQDDVLISKRENWRKLQTIIDQDKTYSIDSKQPKVKIWPTIYKAAAAISLLIVSYIGWLQYTNSSFEDEQQQETTVETIVKRNPSGRKSTLKLPDGTVVKLNSESQISFPSAFIGAHREITLTGEAFLEVVYNPKKPFIIKTGGLETRVLGTSLNISAYPDQTTQKVALLEGSAQVIDTERSMNILLEPGEMVITEKQEMKKSLFDYDAEFGWKDGKLVFNNVNNEELFSRLEKWFGYRIVLERTISSGNYTTTFTNESLKEVLTIIGETKGFSFTINKEEKNVIIK